MPINHAIFRKNLRSRKAGRPFRQSNMSIAELDRVEFGYKVFRLRRKLYLSQAELGSKIGVSQGYIAHVERGDQNITLENMSRLAEALGQRLLIDFAAPGGMIKAL